MHTRRNFLCSSILTLCGAYTARAEAPRLGSEIKLHHRLEKLEAQSGGRVGAAVFHRAAPEIGYRLDERFPMCSTFKVLAVAAVLARVDRGLASLERSIPIREGDILKYAPVTSHRVGPNGMTLFELCQAALTVSDNTAANLLLHTLGGPEGVTKFARSLGDFQTQLDRIEPMLNQAAPGDLRDTSTPGAMAKNLASLLWGAVLSDSSRALLKNWMVQSKTGAEEIRSALPATYLVGDKTGSGEHNTANDIGVIWPPTGLPAAVAIYMTGVRYDSPDQRAALIADVTRACLPDWV